MILKRHLQVLSRIAAALEGKPIDWVVTGSTALALWGMALEIHDLDIESDQAGAYAIERELAGYVVTPVRYLESERIRSHLGKLLIDGLQVEIMGAVQTCGPAGDWETFVDLGRERRFVRVAGECYPVFSPRYEYQAYLSLGRPEKARLIQEWLSSFAFPAGLSNPARRALAAVGVRDLHDLTAFSEVEVGRLHGMGPKGVDMLRAGLEAHQLEFKPSTNER